MTNRQAVGLMHCSCHRLTASVALLARWPVRQKLNHVSSIQFISVTSLCTRLNMSKKHLWCALQCPS